jgi:hypothetical protein
LNPLSTLEKIAAGVIAALLLAIAIIIWWHLHNRTEQKIGATACIQSTTETKQAAVTNVATTEAEQHIDVNAIIRGYDAKVQSLSSANDALARRLSASSAVCSSSVPNPGPAADPNAADRRVGKSESQLERILDAGDANQIKVEDCADLYNKVRDRAIAAEAARKK